MTERQQSCEQVTIVTVNEPYQVVYEGVVYHPDDRVVDVLDEVAVRWVAWGWASYAAKSSGAQKAAPDGGTEGRKAAAPSPPKRSSRW